MKIDPSATIEVGVKVGRFVKVGAGAQVLAQKSGQNPQTQLCESVEIGAGATIQSGVNVGYAAQVKPGATVSRNVPPQAVVDGIPARVIAYRVTDKYPDPCDDRDRRLKERIKGAEGVRIYPFPHVVEPRGTLIAADFGTHLPFEPKRFFLVLNVPCDETRGDHAHKTCEQFLIAVKGSVRVVADDGQQRREFSLDRPDFGLYLPTLTWGSQYQYSSDCVLLVLASEVYDANDYIRSYEEFRCLTSAPKKGIDAQNAPSEERVGSCVPCHGTPDV